MPRTGRPITHGEARHSAKAKQTPEYRAWASIIERCYDTSHPVYTRYGGRGIFMYAAWRDSYVAFRDYLVETIGRKPGRGYSLDRIDNDRGYEPGNIRWATWKEQNNNRRDNKPQFTAFGVTMSRMEWAKAVDLNYGTLASRIDKLGWSPERAVGLYVAGL